MIGGNPQGLAEAERAIGLHSWAVSFDASPYQYHCDEVVPLVPDAPLANEKRRLGLLWRAIRDFDVVHFNFGGTLTATPISAGSGGAGFSLGRSIYNTYAALVEMKDLPLLKAAGKAIFVTFQGADARQADYCLRNFRISPVSETGPERYLLGGSDERKRERIARFERYADGIFALNPDLMHVLPSRTKFLPYAHVDPRQWSLVLPGAERRVPIVVHAPTHRQAKGTRFLLEALSRLRDDGVPFELRLIEGLPHADARRAFAEADLVIDQLLAGWYGGVAVECMALGKPVVSYIRKEDLGYLDPDMRAQLPVICAEPETIYGVLKECLTADRQRLVEIGMRGRAYVERWHDPIAIARFLKAEYAAALDATRRGDRPDE